MSIETKRKKRIVIESHMEKKESHDKIDEILKRVKEIEAMLESLMPSR